MAVTRREIIGDCELILGDCLEVLPTLGPVDAVVTDPPYGIGADKGAAKGGSGFYAVRFVNTYSGEWDTDRPDPRAFAHLLAAAPRHIVWGGNYFTDLLPVSGKWLWWDKCQTMPTYADGEMAWTSLPGVAPKKFVYSNNGLMAKEKDRVHPTQKPVAVMLWCLGFLPNAETILDPFMGSGTTLVACAKLGRKGIGIEIDPGYFDIACRRVEEAYRQPDMFIERPAAPVQEPLDL